MDPNWLNTALLTVLLAYVVSMDARVRNVEARLMNGAPAKKGG